MKFCKGAWFVFMMLAASIYCPAFANAQDEEENQDSEQTDENDNSDTEGEDDAASTPTEATTDGESGDEEATYAADGNDREGSASDEEGGEALGFQRSGRMEFDERLVKGQAAKSGAVYLFKRTPRRLPGLVPFRRSYRSRIVEPVLGKRELRPPTYSTDGDAETNGAESQDEANANATPQTQDGAADDAAASENNADANEDADTGKGKKKKKKGRNKNGKQPKRNGGRK
ncbi:MAG: hypothetical protein JXX14_23570 [Deltaproteobacteria bacterium]|nr:hypothetical protein [Deltaproteobacteria bacterium]